MNDKAHGGSTREIVWIAILSIAILLFVTFCCVGVTITDIIPGKKNLKADINVEDEFIREREKQVHLSTAIPKYDLVITAIERFHQDHGTYPVEISDLIPRYLSEEPKIYLSGGETIKYANEPWGKDTPPYTFMIGGHYPFPASMHGWHLIYCPEAYAGCKTGGDRYIRAFMVNADWIWLHSSAL